MDDSVTVVIDEASVQFTPDGRVRVLDAIASLSGRDESVALWQSLLAQQPELSALCETYAFSGQTPALVTDSVGWEVIQSLLFDFLLDTREP